MAIIIHSEYEKLVYCLLKGFFNYIHGRVFWRLQTIATFYQSMKGM